VIVVRGQPAEDDHPKAEKQNHFHHRGHLRF
jgi:hypothetical protein